MELNCKAYVQHVQPCYNSKKNMTFMKFLSAHSVNLRISHYFSDYKSLMSEVCAKILRGLCSINLPSKEQEQLINLSRENLSGS